MAKTIEQLKAQSAEVKNASVVGENTATRVGTLFTDIVEHQEMFETQQAQKDAQQSGELENKLTAETERAKAAEQANTTAIAAEVERAKAAEGENAEAISYETTRAEAAEKELTDALAAETNARTVDISNETVERTKAIGVVYKALQTEADERAAADVAIQETLSAEVERAKAVEQANTDSINKINEGNLELDIFLYATNTGYITTNGVNVNSRDENWVYSDYISANSGDKYNCLIHGHVEVSSIVFYDNKKNVIDKHSYSAEGNSGEITDTFIAPEGTAYIRVCGGNPEWPSVKHEQYVKTNYNFTDDIDNLKKQIAVNELIKLDIISPYAIYTTCNDVVTEKKGRNRNYSQAIYLDHFLNGLTEELEIRIKHNIDKVVFNAPMVVTDSNENNPAVTFNYGENIHEEDITCYIHGKNIEETSFNVNHRSTLNRITCNYHPKVLCIGDSITYGEQAKIPDDNYTQNYVYHLVCKELFMKDKVDNGNIGYDISFLGIYKKTKTFTYNDKEYDVVTHHEGIRGIKLKSHLNGEVAQFKDDDTGKWSLRAWINKYRTMNDDGDRLSLGDGTGTLISSKNINNIDVCKPTHVIIMLGANGGGTLSQWQEMVNTIKSEFPDIIIGIAISDAAGTYFPSLHPNYNSLCTIWNDRGSQGSRHNQQYELQKMLQEYYCTPEFEADNIYILPLFFVAPTAESVAIRTVDLPDAEYTSLINNKFYNNYGWHASTHVNGIGHINWGYCLYSWLKYTIAKNIE